jgi:hypothetical protein
MGESKEVIELKRKELVKELRKPKEEQNKDKILRLKENIERHKRWEYLRDRAKKKNRKHH